MRKISEPRYLSQYHHIYILSIWNFLPYEKLVFVELINNIGIPTKYLFFVVFVFLTSLSSLYCDRYVCIPHTSICINDSDSSDACPDRHGASPYLQEGLLVSCFDGISVCIIPFGIAIHTVSACVGNSFLLIVHIADYIELFMPIM